MVMWVYHVYDSYDGMEKEVVLNDGYHIGDEMTILCPCRTYRKSKIINELGNIMTAGTIHRTYIVLEILRPLG